MPRCLRPLLVAVCLALAASSATAAPRDRPPAWAANLHTAPLTVERAEASAVCLLDASAHTYTADGVRTEVIHGAIRVLTGDGVKHAIATIAYDGRADKVLGFQAWIVRPDGRATLFDSKRVIDVSPRGSGQIATERRLRLCDASGDVQAGDTLIWAATVERTGTFFQLVWRVQTPLPVERSRLSLTLPPDWRLQHQLFDAPAPVPPVVKGATHTWTFPAQPSVKPEVLPVPGSMPSPWLAVDVLPPASAKLGPPPSTTWEELSRSFATSYDERAQPDAAVQDRAAAAVASATTPLGRLRALARLAQEVNYVAIDLNLATGGGYVPRRAADVCRVGYGDCKDKTTYLRALLQTQGIPSYALIVNSGQDAVFTPAWVSPYQFNHCIIAIPVDAAIESPAILTHPQLGRLLIFDPTDENLPFGYLNHARLHPQALLVSRDVGGLIRLPEPVPGANRLERRVTAKLTPAGALSGTIEEDFVGTAAADVIREHRGLAPSDYTKLIEGWLGATMASPRAPRVEARLDDEAGTFRLALDFTSPSYGKAMRNVLLVFKPVLVGRRESVVLDPKPRQHPIRLPGWHFHEQAAIELPEGFRVDELPPPVEVQAEFGRYQSTVRVTGQLLTLERTYDVRPTDLPASAAGAVRSFYEKVLQAEQTPVVLEKL